MSCRGANRLAPSSATPGRLRKNVTCRPMSRPPGSFTTPVTYHHSLRKSGWLPWSRGNARPCLRLTTGNSAARAIGVDDASTQARNARRFTRKSSPVFLDGADDVVAHRMASAHHGRERCERDHDDDECEQLGRGHAERHAPMERLAVDDVDQHQADDEAERDAGGDADRA